jgi:zinc protease
MLALMSCHPMVPVSPDDIAFPPLTFSIPEPERIELGNGIILYVMEDHELPLIDISAVIKTGSIYDPVGLEGLAEITGIVMRTGGAGKMSGDEVDETLDLIAGTVAVSVGKESCTATLSVLKKDISQGLHIFSDILMKPVFNDDKLRTAKNLEIEGLRRVYDDPQGLAFREFVKLIYEGNTRGRLATINSVERIMRENLIGFHKQFFFPENVMIAVTGDITRDEIVKEIERYFYSWESKGIETEMPPIPRRKEAGSLHYMFKDIPQSVIISGQLAPGKRDSDYYPFIILDFIMGSGGFKSHIFSEVRNNLGLAYSAGSFYSARAEFGAFGTYAMTKPASTVRTMSVVESIIEDAKTNGVSDEELQWAKKSITNSFIFSFSSAHQTAMQQMMVEYEGLPGDYLEKYRDNIIAVTSEDVKKVAVKYLSRTSNTTFVLGNEKGFDSPLSSFGKVNEIKAEY